jgi:carbonyl reductase 1
MIVLITGANRGIGKEVIKQLSSTEGKVTRIILACRNMELGLQARNSVMDLCKTNVQIDCFVVDITKQESIALLKKNLQSLEIDVLINNAAIYDKSNRNLPNAQQTLETNYFGTVSFTNQMLELMSSTGRIINVSSGLGALSNCKSELVKSRVLNSQNQGDLDTLAHEYIQAVKNNCTDGWPYDAYYVSKLLLNRMTVIWNRDFPIPVVAMNPGWTKTDMGGFGAIREVWEGAETIVYLTLIEEIKTYGGKFVQDRQIITF